MAARAARVKSRKGSGVRHPLIEPEGVVHVMDVAVGDAEVLLDLFGRQREHVRHAVANAAGNFSAPTSDRVRNGSALLRTTLEAISVPSPRTTPLTWPARTSILETEKPVRIWAPASVARRASSFVTAPIPPCTIIHVPSEPGRRHMLWTRKFVPVPGVPNPAL